MWWWGGGKGLVWADDLPITKTTQEEKKKEEADLAHALDDNIVQRLV